MLKDKNNGFTLMEILVAINLAFITVTLIISFYMITNKVFLSTIKKVETGFTINNSLYNMNELLKKSEEFTFISQKDSIFIIFNCTDKIVFTEKKISIKDVYEIESFEEFILSITDDKGNESIYRNGNKAVNSYTGNTESTLNSCEIYSINIVIKKDNHLYSFNYTTPDISTKRFRNKIKDVIKGNLK